MLLRQRPQLALLSLAQALYWSCSIIGIALTGLVGQKLTPWPLLATLPLTLLVAGNLLAVGPLARWTQQIGRARALQRGALLGVAAGLLAAAALAASSFGLFCLAMLMLGGYRHPAAFIALPHSMVCPPSKKAVPQPGCWPVAFWRRCWRPA